ncbi:ubiquinone biosynthesis protein COQ4, mitochondrial [Mycena filopes]|nr:ubiquinone biosynthesis protein COQ4, mitochondrial [Mycena filopes]
MTAILRSHVSRTVLRPPKIPRALPGLIQATRSIGSKVPAYEGHIPLNWFENGVLAVGSAFMSLADPRRGGPSLPRLRDRMLESPEGRQILKTDHESIQEPWICRNSPNTQRGTLARAYITWLERCGVTPDTREPVHYIDDPELAYVMQRYRECHDFYHCIVNLPVSVDSEIAVKYFEFANLGLPLAALSALFGPLRLNSAQRQRLFSEYVPWALRCGGSARSLITVYWEQRWDQNVEDMKKEFGLWDAPAAKWRKPLTEARIAAEKQQQRRAETLK